MLDETAAEPVQETPRITRERLALLALLSFMKSMVHPYYCLPLAPAVAAMYAIGVAEMSRRRGG